ncbi:MAG: arginine repressor [Christensenellaceae bacterium]|jgi:transcriptional regulator of arginine metabolism
MKAKRQSKIVELIKTYEIDTQEELVQKLRESGYNVTQATVSRDIKELKLIKIQNAEGLYYYSLPKSTQANDSGILMRIFKDTVLTVHHAQNLVILKTITGSANAAAEMIDNLPDEIILGTLAGDNTIFVATATEQAAAQLSSKFTKLLDK